MLKAVFNLTHRPTEVPHSKANRNAEQSSKSIHPVNSDRLSVYRSVFKILSNISIQLYHKAYRMHPSPFLTRLNAKGWSRILFIRRDGGVYRGWHNKDHGAGRWKFQVPIWKQLDGSKIKRPFAQFRLLLLSFIRHTAVWFGRISIVGFLKISRWNLKIYELLDMISLFNYSLKSLCIERSDLAGLHELLFIIFLFKAIRSRLN